MLTLESATLVLVGKFNPYIISPDWLEKLGIWSATDTRLSLGAAGDDGIQFRGNRTDWQVSGTRLVIRSVEEDCGRIAKEVLNQLPHTPIEQSLSTFSFSVDGSPISGVFGAIIDASKNDSSESEPELIRWGFVTHDGPARADLMFVRGNEGTTVSVIRRRSTETVKAAIAAALQFKSDREKSELLIKRIIGKST